MTQKNKMKGLTLLLMVTSLIQSIRAEAEEEVQQNVSASYDYNAEDDVESRLLRQVQLYTDDERCTDIGVCSGLNYEDDDVVVTFDRKPQIHITSQTTYEVKSNKDYFTLSFVDSNFANFPLNLFYAFQLQELDLRNCSLKILKWDNFLGAENLTILLLSENLLTEIKPMVFGYAENLSFLFLDANRISTLYNDSFKGLANLNFLDLHNNLIATLPADLFSHLPSIQQINLAENRLKVIEHVVFADNPRLFSIQLQRNDLNEIQEYAFRNQYVIKYLDISHNPNLEVLVCTNMIVENLWAKNCSLNRINIYGEAVHVDLQQNFIKELYFSKPEFLETLRLRDNALEQISSLALTTNLRIFDVSNNPKLKTLPDLWQINSLERLDLSNTSLKEIPVSVLASSNKIRSLNVSFNQLEEINPLNFKYIEKLSHFYIENNNWNCYNLQMLMDMVIKPFKISYTQDKYDENFPGEYIQGIKCMYRLEPTDNNDLYIEAFSTEQLDNLAEEPGSVQAYNQLKFENTKEVEKLRREFKAIVGIYEQKFSLVLDKLKNMDMRLKQFENFNESLWRQVSIVV